MPGGISMLLFPVDLEAGVARLEEIHNLACGGKTCIHVGLGRLGAIFFGVANMRVPNFSLSAS